jgi:enamine deaminase RidA (YjgF/YER057c/UK114 family)
MIKLIFGKNRNRVFEKNKTIVIELESKCYSKNKVLTIDGDFNLLQNTANFSLFKDEKQGLLFGCFFEDVSFPVSEVADKIYSKLFSVLGGNKLYRIWNYIPNINTIVNGEEVYRQFNSGRLNSFKKSFGGNFNNFPAATGIDIISKDITICFLAGQEEPINLHNPNQIKPMDYSSKFGKLPPVFARATTVQNYVFISGTASIVGEETIGVGVIEKQLETTFFNLKIMLEDTNYNSIIGKKTAIIYFRFEKDKKYILNRFSKEFPAFSNVICLKATICRKELDVEIEMMVN